MSCFNRKALALLEENRKRQMYAFDRQRRDGLAPFDAKNFVQTKPLVGVAANPRLSTLSAGIVPQNPDRRRKGRREIKTPSNWITGLIVVLFLIFCIYLAMKWYKGCKKRDRNLERWRLFLKE